MWEAVRRWLLFFVGLFFMGLGIALTTNAQLGTTPISSVPLVLASFWGTTLGVCTFGINVVMLLLQVPLLGRAFTWKRLLQLPGLVVFAAFIDLGMWLTHPFIPAPWAARGAMCLAGCVVMAFGIMLEVLSGTTVLPGEGLVLAIAWRSRANFGNVKVLFDVSLVLIAVALGVWLLGGVRGVREGTLASAVLTGVFVRFMSARLGPRIQVWIAGTAGFVNEK